MHDMQTIVTDVRGACLSVCLSVTRLISALLCGRHSVQPLPNHFGLLLSKQLEIVSGEFHSLNLVYCRNSSYKMQKCARVAIAITQQWPDCTILCLFHYSL